MGSEMCIRDSFRCEKRYLVADYFEEKALGLFEKRLEKSILQTEKSSKETDQRSAKEDSCPKEKFDK